MRIWLIGTNGLMENELLEAIVFERIVELLHSSGIR